MWPSGDPHLDMPALNNDSKQFDLHLKLLPSFLLVHIITHVYFSVLNFIREWMDIDFLIKSTFCSFEQPACVFELNFHNTVYSAISLPFLLHF